MAKKHLFMVIPKRGKRRRGLKINDLKTHLGKALVNCDAAVHGIYSIDDLMLLLKPGNNDDILDDVIPKMDTVLDFLMDAVESFYAFKTGIERSSYLHLN